MQNTDYLDKKIEEHKKQMAKAKQLRHDIYLDTLTLCNAVIEWSKLSIWPLDLEAHYPPVKHCRQLARKIIDQNATLMNMEAEND